jgi:choline dehydrogenase
MTAAPAPRGVYDYVIIGSGSAGSTLAGRLSEDGASSVLLLEAGPRDNSIYIRMPAALGVPLTSRRFNWYYHSEPDPHIGGRRIYEARGRVLGGSSSINGMNWVRGNPWDYDNWAAEGLAGWSYADCLPYFKRAETFDKGANAYRGGAGPMKIETCPAEGELFRAFLEAGVQAGHGRVEDHNAFRQEGVHVTQRNVHGAVRWSASRAYIDQAGPRANLTVLTGLQATGIELSNKRAVRLHCQGRAGRVSFEVGRELILAAGAINTPQLLLLSGIGDGDELRRLSIPVRVNLPGVGRNLTDHIAASVQCETKGKVSMAGKLGRLGRAKIAAQWLLLKNGLGNTNYFETGAFIRTDDGIKVPNVQFEFIPLVGDFQYGNVTLTEGFQYFFALMRPTSRGRVWIDSADPMAAPKFVFNYLSTAEDRQQAVAAVRAIRDILGQSAFAACIGRELSPGPDIGSDEEILAFLSRTVGTQYHPCCTCRMGHDPQSVVDDAGRVHETDNLRVVDASIMPAIVTGNLNAPVIMMAEKISDAIRGRPPLPPDPMPYYRA